MTERLTHIADDELIDLAIDNLADGRVAPVLDHLAECDDCARRSSLIYRTATVWDGWRERLRVEDAEVTWRGRVSQVIAELSRRSGQFGVRIAAQLARLAEAPETLASAALGVLLDPATRAVQVVADAAYTAGIADPPVEFAVLGTRSGGSETHEEASAMIITAGIPSGAQVTADAVKRSVSVEFADGTVQYLVLLIPSSEDAETMVAETRRTSYGAEIAEFTDVPQTQCLLTVYRLP
jgi:hypothetical protein